jgi:hypothetical protein
VSHSAPLATDSGENQALLFPKIPDYATI